MKKILAIIIFVSFVAAVYTVTLNEHKEELMVKVSALSKLWAEVSNLATQEPEDDTFFPSELKKYEKWRLGLATPTVSDLETEKGFTFYRDQEIIVGNIMKGYGQTTINNQEKRTVRIVGIDNPTTSSYKVYILKTKLGKAYFASPLLSSEGEKIAQR